MMMHERGPDGSKPEAVLKHVRCLDCLKHTCPLPRRALLLCWTNHSNNKTSCVEFVRCGVALVTRKNGLQAREDGGVKNSALSSDYHCVNIRIEGKRQKCSEVELQFTHQRNRGSMLNTIYSRQRGYQLVTTAETDTNPQPPGGVISRTRWRERALRSTLGRHWRSSQIAVCSDEEPIARGARLPRHSGPRYKARTTAAWLPPDNIPYIVHFQARKLD
jgi:hypothetical protein